uniref:B box-type domain-containing protein n=1 Tax=Nelumbo nucifera TaxID=4432 RepID=A0A822XNS1_NELNU|nr:TPA_asm: hypothetical protein HUJ06_024717 [Nelumbo nucifera]
MDPVCDFCGVARAVVYCRSDITRLCLNCDSFVHSANAISQRHCRSLICNKCNSQPAVIGCLEDKMYLCQSCDSNGCGCTGPGHRRQAVTFYSGSPTALELSRIWPSNSNASSPPREVNASLEPPGLMSMNENCISNSWEPRDNGSSSAGLTTTNRLNELEPCTTFDPWACPSSVIQHSVSSMPYCEDKPPFFPEELKLSKGCSPLKDLEICHGGDLCEGLNMDGVELNFENSDEIFGCSESQPSHSFEDIGMDCLFMDKNFSVADSSCPSENVLEASSSSGQPDYIALQSSYGAGSATAVQGINSATDRVFLNPNHNKNINLSFPPQQVNSSLSLSFSNLTGESSVSDYQDCGVSPMFLTGESPWDSNLDTSCPQARDKAKMRYNEKKKTRMYVPQLSVNKIHDYDLMTV